MITDALATYRITRFITEDYLAEPFRNAVHDKFGYDSKINYLVNCPWCTSIYVGVMVVAFKKLAPAAWEPVAAALSLSAVASLIQTEVEHDD